MFEGLVEMWDEVAPQLAEISENIVEGEDFPKITKNTAKMARMMYDDFKSEGFTGAVSASFVAAILGKKS